MGLVVSKILRYRQTDRHNHRHFVTLCKDKVNVLLKTALNSDISFQTGRVDCDTAPYTDDDVELPSATLTYEGNILLHG